MINNDVLMRNIKRGYQFVRGNDGKTFGEELTDRVSRGEIDPEEADLARIDARPILAKKTLRNVAAGHGHYELISGCTHRQYLRYLINGGFIDQEEGHLAIIKGRKSSSSPL